MKFYIGLHMVAHAHRFERCMISVNRLAARRSDFAVNDWMLDSGAFTRITQHGEHWPAEWYAEQIARWSRCGNIECAVTQDWMCEPFVIQKTGLSVREHQRLTIARFDDLIGHMKQDGTAVYLLPVLQGYSPDEYAEHIDQYGQRLRHADWCGVGSVCKRNASPSQVISVLRAIRGVRPDLRLHGFGLKETALRNGEVRRMLHSADSMAWSFAARREGRDRNCPHEAQRYADRIELQPSLPLLAGCSY